MLVTQQQHADMVKIYSMIGAVIMAIASDGLETTLRRITAFMREELARTEPWSPEMKTLMQSAIEALEIYPNREVVARHRDGDDGVV